MRSRTFIAVGILLLVLFAGAGAVLAYDSSRHDVIASGVRVGGVEVGDLTLAQARTRLQAVYRARMNRPLILRYGAKRFVLRPQAAHLAVDLESGLQQALQRSRADNLFVRVFRSLSGGRINVSIDPQVTYSTAAVQRVVGGIARKLDQAPHDATIAFSGDSIGRVASAPGIAVRQAALSAAIGAALRDANAPRAIRIPVSRTEPKVTTAALAARYPTVITVDRATFTLRLWKRLRLVKRYEIAVGMAGLETPAGLYHIQDKQVNPSWHVPNSAWAGSLAGKVIPPGPADPIKARWMAIYNGAGIHGTDELSSLGSAASHGCIRMAIPDVIQLYSQTPLGTPVYIE